MSHEAPYTIIYTNDVCKIAGKYRPGIPLLIRRGGAIVEPASDWLRRQAIMKGAAPSSLRTYAEVLQLSWGFLEEEDARRAREAVRENRVRIPLTWDTVDDDVLIAWRDHQIAEGVSGNTIQWRIQFIYRFYLDAQDAGAVHDIIGEPRRGDDGRLQKLPISLTVTRTRERHGQTRTQIQGNIKVPQADRKGRDRHTPTEDEARRVTIALGRGDEVIATRDTLMASWAEEVGLRRKEFAALTVQQVMGPNDLRQLDGRGELYSMRITVTKGGKTRRVLVPKALLERTRDYIRFERADLIAAVKTRVASYHPPDDLFLGVRTGEPLDLGSISNIFSAAFKEAGVGGWLHRLRAGYLTNITRWLFEIEYDRWGNDYSPHTIMTKVAEIAGHKNIETLRPYLDTVVKEHFEKDKAAENMAVRLRDLSSRRALEDSIRRTFQVARLREMLCGDADVDAVLGLVAEATGMDLGRNHI